MLKKSLLGCFMLSALAAAPMHAQATVLTFEDLPEGKGFFLADYHGFRFGTNNLSTTAWFYTDETDGPPLPQYTPNSPTRYVSTDQNTPGFRGGLLEEAQSITSVDDFIFDGAYFSGFDPIGFKLFKDGVLVHTSATVNLGNFTAVPTFVSSGYGGSVDQVVVLATQGFFAMDDFTYRVPGTPITAPGGLPLVGLAAVIAALARRRVGR